MSQFPSQPPASPSHLPPPIPISTPIPAGPIARPGPVGGPMFPYQPGDFETLYLWWAILAGVYLLVLMPAIIIFPLGAVAFPLRIAGFVLECVLLFKAWNQIQDGHQRTSPGKALGYSFIPFFNFYWWFVAYQGLAEDTNSYLRRYGINAPAVSAALAMTCCILSICKWVLIWLPVVGPLLHIAEITILFFFLYQVKIANIAIAQAKLTAAAQAGTFRST